MTWLDMAPASAYSALTASSKLQRLALHQCNLPAGVWQHMFPAGRQLPHLQELDISWVNYPDPAAAPEGSCLVSCCPGVRVLHMQELECSAELLTPLTGLIGLRELSWGSDRRASAGLEVVCQLTGLERLSLRVYGEPGGLLLQLTQLQLLTHLKYQLFVSEWPYHKDRMQLECRVRDCICHCAQALVVFLSSHLCSRSFTRSELSTLEHLLWHLLLLLPFTHC